MILVRPGVQLDFHSAVNTVKNALMNRLMGVRDECLTKAVDIGYAHAGVCLAIA